MDSIDYTVLTGIAVVAAARYYGRARGSFRDDLNNNVFVLLAVLNALKHNTWVQSPIRPHNHRQLRQFIACIFIYSTKWL